MLICVARLNLKPLGVPRTEKIKRSVDSHVRTLKELSYNCHGRSFRTKENSLSAKKVFPKHVMCKISSVSLNGISMYNTFCTCAVFSFFCRAGEVCLTLSIKILWCPLQYQTSQRFNRIQSFLFFFLYCTCAFEEKVRLK